MIITCNKLRSVFLTLIFITISTQLISCKQSTTKPDNIDKQTITTQPAALPDGWLPLKQKNDGTYRITVGSGESKLFISIRDDSFSVTSNRGKKLPGCKNCTEEFRKQFNLGENCEGADEKFGITMCNKPNELKSFASCPPDLPCICDIDSVRFCCPIQYCQ